MSTKNNFNCPHCGKEINIDEVLQKDIDNQVKATLKEAEAKYLADAESRVQEALKEQNKEFVKRLAEEQEKAHKLRERELEELQGKSEIDRQARIEAEKRVLDAEKRILENRRLLEEKEKEIVRENEKKMDEYQRNVEEKTRSRIENENTLKQAQDAIAMQSLRREIDDLKRKAEQTSQQLIGEAQEIALEDALRMAFPTDIVEPVGKGMKGADCIQKVRTNGDVLGIIVWESKRTKQWLNEWTAKLKDDQRNLNASLSILVTQSLPSDMKIKAGIYDGVWVCDFPTAIPMAIALRAGIIETAAMKTLSTGSDEKAARLYEYLTSPDFRGNMQALVEIFATLEADLAARKRAFDKQCKKEQMTYARALTATNRIFGSLQGVLGEKALPDIERSEQRQLEA